MGLVQGLRALAALMVVIHHAQAEAWVLSGRSGSPFTPATWLPWPAGVDIFFVISGFIIVHASRRLYGASGGARRFLAHRVARLVPLYWLVTGLYLAVALTVPGVLNTDGTRPDAAYVAASFLFWPALRADGAALPLYGLGWTLQYEVLFYLLFATVLGRGRRAAVCWTVGVLGLLVVVALAFPRLPMPFAFWANPIVIEFAFGALLGLGRAEGVRLGRTARLGLAILGLGLLVGAGTPDAVTRPVLWGLPALCLVASAVLGRDHAPDESRVLGWAAALGDASYALYLVHPFALRFVRELIARSGVAWAFTTWPGAWAGIAFMVVVAVLAAWAVHSLVERPMTRHIRRSLDPAEPTPEKSCDGVGARVPAGGERH